jgi:hypothetical protein
MARSLHVAAALALAALAGGAMGAAAEPGVAGNDNSGVVLAAKPSPTPTPAALSTNLVSPVVSAEIASGMPSYKAVDGAAGAAAADTSASDAEKPRNLIPRLPVEVLRKYEVRESRIPVFRTRDLYTEEGLTELSFKEHPGLRIGNIFNLNAPAAHERIVAEQLFAARLDLVDAAFAMASGGDTHEIEAMRQDIIEDGFNKESPVGR